MAQLEAGGQAQLAAMASLRGCVWRLALEPLGCRAVQLALQVADQTNRDFLLAELQGHVREAVVSPHANYVVQQVVEVMPTPLVAFVAEELTGAAGRAARHRYGCRILCRLLEHTIATEATATLVDELLAETAELSRHRFGHHVVESALEHGLPEQRKRIALALVGDLQRHARNRNASYVVEAALGHCGPDEREALATGLLNGPGGLAALAQSQFGYHVVRAVLRHPGGGSDAALRQLQRATEELRGSRYGQKLLESLRMNPTGRG